MKELASFLKLQGREQHFQLYIKTVLKVRKNRAIMKVTVLNMKKVRI